jgi:hypothetical protein
MTKEAKREYDRKWKAANSKRINAKRRELWAQNPEKYRAIHRKWRAENLEKCRAATRKWGAHNRDKCNISARKWEAANPDKVKNAHLKRKYNITLEEYNLILSTQNGLCAGCKQPAAHFKRRLHVDHSHSDKIVRGLLCWPCNNMLPARRNIKEVLGNLLEYLNDPPAIKALGGERKTK